MSNYFRKTREDYNVVHYSSQWDDIKMGNSLERNLDHYVSFMTPFTPVSSLSLFHNKSMFTLQNGRKQKTNKELGG